MIDTRIFFFVLGPDQFGDLTFWAPAAFHDAGFIAQNGEGWTPVSHTVTPTNDGSIMVAIMCNREIEAPDFDRVATANDGP